MPNHKSAIKRVRQNEKRRIRNRHIMSTTRTFLKRVRAAIENGDAGAAQEALPSAVNALNRAVTKGIMHRNQASRKISRLTVAVNKLD
jgi:small subunit ribosomal protein S20